MSDAIRNIVGSPKLTPGEECAEIYDSSVHLGVEIETENSCVHPMDAEEALSYWNCTSDGSLKSSYPWEFIFAGPLCGKAAVNALTEIDEYLSKTPVKYPLNTGVHVHINVGDLTRQQLRRFVYLLLVTESALMQYSGGKFNNNFCLPWFNASHRLVHQFGRFLDGDSNKAPPAPVKYSTINIASVFKLGTVEVRTMTGTHSKKRILDWINVLLRLRDIAVNVLHDDEVWDYTVSPSSVIQFLLKIWDEETVSRMLHKKLHQDMLASSLIARTTLFPKTSAEFSKEFGFVKKPSKSQDRVQIPETHTFADLVQTLSNNASQEIGMAQAIIDAAWETGMTLNQPEESGE